MDRIVVAGNDVALPLLRAELPKDLGARVVEVGELDVHSPRDQILKRSFEAACEQDARDDAERVAGCSTPTAPGGLGVVGVDGDAPRARQRAGARASDRRRPVRVARARRAAWRRGGRRAGPPRRGRPTPVYQPRSIEAGELLAEAGGVGGLLRSPVAECRIERQEQRQQGLLRAGGPRPARRADRRGRGPARAGRDAGDRRGDVTPNFAPRRGTGRGSAGIRGQDRDGIGIAEAPRSRVAEARRAPRRGPGLEESPNTKRRSRPRAA